MTRFRGMIRRIWMAVLLGAAVFAAHRARGQAGAGLHLPLDPVFAGYQLTNAFGNLRFQWPVSAVAPPSETNRLFVVEKTGRIQVITNLAEPTASVFLDLSGSVDTSDLETGLLGLAFHPGFATNRTFFVFRTLLTTTEGHTNELHNQLSRFLVSETDPNRADPGSEAILFSQYDTAKFHNAGDLHFGPDGYLYVSVGEDYQLWFESLEHRQAIDRNLQGGILRIDVDRKPGSLPPNPHPGVTGLYAIPPDNPFIGATNFNGSAVEPGRVRTEFWAVGFRNPWRFSIDPETGDLFCADVGDFSFEEVNRVRPGLNYGWPYREGSIRHPFLSSDPASGFVAEPPWVTYSRGAGDDRGNCVVGGFVYRGTSLPELQGSYIYGDFTRGNVWAAKDSPTGVAITRLTGDTSLSAFGKDPRNGDILVLNVREGTVRRLVWVPPAVAEAQFPQRLSQTGAFADLATLKPVPGVVPYDINVPFWSDHALKQRWYSLPPGTAFDFQADDPWGLPVGAVWVKHFEMEMVTGYPGSRRRLETRFLVRMPDDVYGVTYRWNEEQTDAVLVPSGGQNENLTVRNPKGEVVREQIWRYPSHNGCRTCHNPSAGFSLGFNTSQLNCDIADTDGLTNQLIALVNRGALKGYAGPDPSHRALVRAGDETKPLLDRVRSYLAANCASCHHPGSGLVNGATWDARIHIPLGASGITNNGYIVPGNAAASTLIQRVHQRGPFQMPPIATQQLDLDAVQLLHRWVNAVPAGPWKPTSIGNASRDGSVSVEAGIHAVAGPGPMGGPSDTMQFLGQPLAGDDELVGQLVEIGTDGTAGRAGLMFRHSMAPDAPFVFVGLGTDGFAQFGYRKTAGAEAEFTTPVQVRAPASFRLLRRGSQFTGRVSADGKTWMELGSVSVEMGTTAEAGVAAAASRPDQVLLARVQGLAVPRVTVSGTSLTGDATAPAAFRLTADIRGIDAPAAVARLEFLAGGQVLGEVSQAPFQWVWKEVSAGEHWVTARVTDDLGNQIQSTPTQITVRRPVGLAGHVQTDPATQGNWLGRYGQLAHRLAGAGTGTGGSGARIEFTRGFEFVWDENPTDPRALQRGEAGGRLAACWVAGDQPELEVALDSGRTARLTVYLVDWDTSNQRAQRMELWDADRSNLLDSREVRSFSGGVYLTWQIRGRVRIVAVPLTEAKAVISGVFVDPVDEPAPSIRLVAPPQVPRATLPVDVPFQVEVPEGATAPVRVEYFANGKLLGTSTEAPHRLTWASALAGQYMLAARAWSPQGNSAVSNPVDLELVMPATRVDFLGTNDAFAGTWRGVLGSEGWIIPNLDHQWLDRVSIQVGGNPFTWPDPVPGPPALQLPDGEGRIASAYYDFGELPLSLATLDGQPRRVSLYLLDWDRGGRRSQIDVMDMDSGRTLDSREAGSFEGGRLYQWQVVGPIQFRIRPLDGNAVLNGVFLDPAFSTLELWRRQHFSVEALEDPRISADGADPDRDQVANLAEYALGLDPLLADSDAGLELDRGADGWWLRHRRRLDDPGLVYELETSRNLIQWEPGTPYFREDSQTGQAGEAWVTVIYRGQPALEGDAPRFVRLRIWRSGP